MRHPRITSPTTRTALATLTAASLGAAALAAAPALATSTSVDPQPIGTYATGQFDESAAEIVAHDPKTQRLFVVNAQSGKVDVLDVSDPTNPTKLFDLSAAGLVSEDGSTIDADAEINSAAVSKGVLAVAVAAGDKVSLGWVAFFDTSSAAFLGAVRVGSLPDSLAFSDNGKTVVVANEGEPADDFSSDPEGSISVISLSGNLKKLSQADVATADFAAFEGAALPAGVRVYGPDVAVPAGQPAAGRVARNLEPEYVAIDKKTAYVTLQENNAIAVVDLTTATVTDILPLGSKDWSAAGGTDGFDASNRDDGITIANWPVQGLYLPDAIATITIKGETYLLTANEGDAREFGDYVDSDRLGEADYVLCPDAFPNAAELKEDENLGRLNVSFEDGFNADAGCYDTIFTLGGRSMSLFTTDGELVWDSGSQLEQLVAAQTPEFFNANNDENDSADNRSDDKGPEPEGIAVGTISGTPYAFLGLERSGGIVTFDLSEPTDPQIVAYVNNRNDAADAETAAALDLGPEGLAFIDQADSPTKKPLLAVGNEVSGTTTVYSVR